MRAPRVIVVGAGITGLAAATTLDDDARRAGVPLSLQVLEAAPRIGGHVQSTCAKGFVIEAGPNGFLNREPHTLALIETLALTDRLVEARAEAKRRYIVRDGGLRLVPDGPATLFTSPALTWRAKLRLLGEPFAAGPPAGEESVHAFAARRLGAETADMLVDAAVSGISAGDCRRLSVAAQFPRLVEMEHEHGSLLRAMFARRPAGAAAGPAKLLSFDQGLGVLTAAMATRLGRAVSTGSPVLAVSRRDGEWRVTLDSGETLAADHVVLAVPARQAAAMVAVTDGALSDALAGFEYAGLAVVALAYRAEDLPRPLDGYGYLTTRPEGLATLGVVWESSLFEGRAPAGSVLLRVMLGGSRRPELAAAPHGQLIGLARAELQRVLGISAAPVHVAVHAWPEAIAQYTLGHLDRRGNVLTLAARHPGLWLCGTSYDGVSFNDAVKSGRLMARQVSARAWGDQAPRPMRRAGAEVRG
jgi:oxygen-dependent protoporphyrinogen oxidase